MRGLLLLAALLLIALPASAADPPNIVVILIDDVSACWVGAYSGVGLCATEGQVGDLSTTTPNIDAMAAEGVMFTNVWAESVCGPARFALMTGTTRRANDWYNTSPEDLGSRDLHPARPNIARTLSAAGWRTGHWGKWHLAGRDRGNGSSANGNGQFFHPTNVGFDTSNGSVGNLTNDISGVVSPDEDEGYESWEECDFAAGTCALQTDYATSTTLDGATAFLGGSSPFFLYVATNAAHRPVHVPPTEVPALFTPDADCDGDPGDLEEVCFKASLEALDTELGTFFASVDWADTVVILIADNGMVGDVAAAENSNWEGDTRCKNTVGNCGLWVPMIVRGMDVDGIGAGVTSTELVQITDIHATVLDLAGVPPDVASHTTGSMMPSTGGKRLPYRSASFVPSLRDASYAGGRDCIYNERYDVTPDATDTMHEEAIRNDTYKLIVHHDASATHPEELFLVTNQYEAEGSDLWTFNGGSYTATEQAACEDLQAKLALMHDEKRGDPCR